MSKRTLLVFDNGTFECKAGVEEDSPQIHTKNQIFRVKDKNGSLHYQLELDKEDKKTKLDVLATKTMFDGVVVYNYDTFEGTLHAILKHLEKLKRSKAKEAAKSKEAPRHAVITECFLNPHFFKRQALSAVFGSFDFETVEFGYDFVYSYLYNCAHNPKMDLSTSFERPFCDVVIQMGHQGVYIVPLDPQASKIHHSLATFIPFGGLAAQTVFYNSIAAKYHTVGHRVAKEDVEEYFKSIRVSPNYLEEIREVVYNGKGNVQIFPKSIPKEKAPRKRVFPFKKRKLEEDALQEDTHVDKKSKDAEEAEEYTEDTELLEEQEQQSISTDASLQSAQPKPQQPSSSFLQEDQEDELKRQKKERLIKGATEHRYKQKIIKALARLDAHVSLLTDRFLLATDPAEYMSRKKAKLAELEKAIKKRNFIRSELKNKKSQYSLALLKLSLAAANQAEIQEESPLMEEIRDAQESDLEILEEIAQIDFFLKENDKTYISKGENPVDLIRHGYNKEKYGGININVEFIRTPEVLFSPSIVGIQQPGIPEALSEIFQSYDVRNIFLTGGFSQLQGLEERIRIEVLPLRYLPNTPVVLSALDPVYDSYKGAFISHAKSSKPKSGAPPNRFFQEYTRKEFLEKGVSIISDADI